VPGIVCISLPLSGSKNRYSTYEGAKIIFLHHKTCKMKTRILTYAVLALLFAYGCKKTDTLKPQSLLSSDEASDVAAAGQPDYVANEVLIKFKPGLSSAGKSIIVSRVQGSIARQLLTKAMQHTGDNDGLYILHVPGGVQDAVARLKQLPDVVFAEPNYIYRHTAVSNDPIYTSGGLWGMYGNLTTPANQYGSQAGEAWKAGFTGSASVVVGVIDEGAMFAHEDLAGNIWTNPFDAADGIDNDGNGYIDDIHGWDFVGNNNTTFDGTLDDHGTHVSGTIGAKGGNGIGVAGVNWNITIITAKFLGALGGSTENAIKAVDYITDFKTRHGLKLVATNNSWGGGSFSQGLKDAIDRSGAQDILFVAAAGNFSSNTDAAPYYPGSYTSANLICVASITSTGGLSWFSNYGATMVDIGAPGSDINSTLPGGGGSSTYGSYDGTSMATPHVTGAAALIASVRPNFTAAQIKSVILNSAVPTASLAGKCVTGGRLDISNFRSGL
jgi:subtilisin family serine protease